ncbi:hypothetical protein PR048_031604 [Dryococelus australis]|uniref:Uncharacterized protein n=1 Tax=Dryococelus australis TaxID=614101 RepID=A0ABQ9G5R7_9NEOP|nr:hypothetical protein PR048_031604 [Dryococelus australis]
MKGRGKWDIPEKTRQPEVLSGTIPTRENPGANPPGNRARGGGRVPPRRTGNDSRRDRSLILACGNGAGQCRWPAGFLGDLPFAPPLHSSVAPYSPHSTLIGSQDIDVKSHPNLFATSFLGAAVFIVVKVLKGSPGFSHFGTAPGDAAGPRVFLEALQFPSALLFRHYSMSTLSDIAFECLEETTTQAQQPAMERSRVRAVRRVGGPARGLAWSAARRVGCPARVHAWSAAGRVGGLARGHAGDVTQSTRRVGASGRPRPVDIRLPPPWWGRRLLRPGVGEACAERGFILDSNRYPRQSFPGEAAAHARYTCVQPHTKVLWCRLANMWRGPRTCIYEGTASGEAERGLAQRAIQGGQDVRQGLLLPVPANFRTGSPLAQDVAAMPETWALASNRFREPAS